MKSLFIALCITLIGSPAITSTSTKPNVYISTSSSAYAYHKYLSCWTLKKSLDKGLVRKITLQKAKEMNRKPCKVCYEF